VDFAHTVPFIRAYRLSVGERGLEGRRRVTVRFVDKKLFDHSRSYQWRCRLKHDAKPIARVPRSQRQRLLDWVTIAPQTISVPLAAQCWPREQMNRKAKNFPWQAYRNGKDGAGEQLENAIKRTVFAPKAAYTRTHARKSQLRHIRHQNHCPPFWFSVSVGAFLSHIEGS